MSEEIIPSVSSVKVIRLRFLFAFITVATFFSIAREVSFGLGKGQGYAGIGNGQVGWHHGGGVDGWVSGLWVYFTS